MSLSAAGQIAWYLNIAGTLVLLGLLMRNGLYRIYRAFSWYLLADLIQQALALQAQGHFRRGANIYMAGQTVKMILSVFVVMELYHFALASHPALALYGRRTVGAVLSASFLIAALGLLVLPIVGSLAGPGKSPLLYYFFALERTMDSAVLLFLVLVSAFMLWFPVRVPKNVATYVGGFVAYFLARWGGVLMIGLRRDWLAELNLAMMSLSLTCLIAWIVLLRAKGEAVSTVTGHRWNPLEMSHLSGQLAALNGKLEAFSGKSDQNTKYFSLHS